jgi:short subunit fatty acids transporter
MNRLVSTFVRWMPDCFAVAVLLSILAALALF